MESSEDVGGTFGLSRALIRAVALLLLLLAGWLDYITGPELASAPFYILVLISIALHESPWICLAYSLLAAAIYLGADLLSAPTATIQIYPYWRALARLVSFGLISWTISSLREERKRLCRSERTLQDKAQELEEKNRDLEEALRQVKRLQAELLAKERRAAVAEAIHLAAYEIERPLNSISLHAEDLGRSVKPHEDIYPLVEKIGERVRDMEEILAKIRDLRREESG